MKIIFGKKGYYGILNFRTICTGDSCVLPYKHEQPFAKDHWNLENFALEKPKFFPWFCFSNTILSYFALH